MKLTLLKFLRHWDKHTPGDVAGFTPEIAERLVKGKIAAVHEPEASPADQADGGATDSASPVPDTGAATVENTVATAAFDGANVAGTQAVAPDVTVDNGGAAAPSNDTAATDTGKQEVQATQDAAAAKGEKPKAKGK